MTLPEQSPPQEPEAAPGPPRRRGVLVYRAIGVVAVGLAAAGAVLPVLPTTVFLLIAVWAFARSSPELAERLRNDRRFGPLLRDWEERGAIPLRAKLMALVLMAGSWASLFFFATRSVLLLGGVAAVLVAVAIFIVSRPNA